MQLSELKITLGWYLGEYSHHNNMFGDVMKNVLTHLPVETMAAILADGNFKFISLNENFRILNKISLKYVP